MREEERITESGHHRYRPSLAKINSGTVRAEEFRVQWLEQKHFLIKMKKYFTYVSEALLLILGLAQTRAGLRGSE